MSYTKDSKFLKKICQEQNSDRIHWECCRVMTLEVYERNQRIMNFGEVGDKFFIIIKGKVNIIFPTRSLKRSLTMNKDMTKGLERLKTTIKDEFDLDKHEENEKKEAFVRNIRRHHSNVDFEYLANFGLVENPEESKMLTSGDIFGDIALLNSKPRAATVEAKETCYLAVVSKKDFHRILCTDAAKSLEERVGFLKALPAFSKVTNNSLQKLALSFCEKTYHKDQKVYDETDMAESINFVKSGEFKLSQGEIVAMTKYAENSDVFLRLSQMKKMKKRVNQRVVIKGKNEIFGYEELIEKKNARFRKCTCYSNFGLVYEVKIETFKKFTCFPEIITFLQKKYQNDYIRSSTNLGPLKEIEKFKQCTSPKISLSSKVQDILKRMRNKEEFSKSPIKFHIPTPSLDNTHKSEFDYNFLSIPKNLTRKNKKSLGDLKTTISKSSKLIAHKSYLNDILKNVKKKSGFDCVSPILEGSKSKLEFTTPRNDLKRWSLFDWVM